VVTTKHNEPQQTSINDEASSVQFAYLQARERRQQSLLDPLQDGWVSEAFAEDAKHQLVGLLAALANIESRDARPLAPFLATESVVGPLRPPLSVVYEDGVTQVLRPSGGPGSPSSMETALIELARPLLEVGGATFHVKVVGVDLQPAAPVTDVLFDSSASNASRSIQQTARLKCVWDTADAKHPRLLTLTCNGYEEVHVKLQGGKWFADCTQAVLGDDPSFVRQLGYGMNYWMQRIERAHHMDDSVRNGLAIGDANGDGLDDVYCCQGPGLPNRLLIQNADGTVTDRADEAGVDWLDQTSSALFLDLDNDGDQDLAIATTGGVLLMENDGEGKYLLRGQLGAQRTDVQALTGADYDADGDLDLYVCVYRPSRGGRRGDFVFHNATTGGPNILFRNDIERRQWSFHDATAETGLDDGATRYSLAAAWEDYDNDGDQDLYVANDYGRGYLYQNHNGRFQDVTESAGLLESGFGMSASWGDYNRDGRADLYVGNMFSSAGSRVTHQAAFQQNASAQQRAVYQRMAKGNSLFVQQADGKFRDVSAEAAVEMGRWAWSSVLTDLNNDGWEDIVVGNGYITADDPGDL
jgi:hypothetical protein